MNIEIVADKNDYKNQNYKSIKQIPKTKKNIVKQIKEMTNKDKEDILEIVFNRQFSKSHTKTKGKKTKGKKTKGKRTKAKRTKAKR